ncbi:MAG TPA: hypothetical protein VL096_06260 [Pirellulaceae bacterium]|nr:hypothetical protein [Pirellulaceae bacterium]
MRASKHFPAIKIDGDYFIEGFLGLKWLPSDEALANRNKWESEVDDVLGKLVKPQSSAAVLKALCDSGKTLTIYPELEKDCNASAIPLDKQKAARSGSPAENCSASVSGANAGQGGGTITKITFSPRQFTAGRCSDAGTKGAGHEADEILFHELTHAMRYSTGQRDSCFTSVVGWGDYEEFLAIVLTNVFSSETGRSLRKDHEGYTLMPRTSRVYDSKGNRFDVNLHDAQIFCNWFRKQLTNFQIYQRPLCNRLASLRSIRWNPFWYL